MAYGSTPRNCQRSSNLYKKAAWNWPAKKRGSKSKISGACLETSNANRPRRMVVLVLGMCLTTRTNRRSAGLCAACLVNLSVPLKWQTHHRVIKFIIGGTFDDYPQFFDRSANGQADGHNYHSAEILPPRHSSIREIDEGSGVVGTSPPP